MMYPSSRLTPGLVGRGLALSFVALLVSACGTEQGGEAQRPPSPVTVAPVESEPAVHRAEYAGRIYGATEVAVRARVSGILERRNYEEGMAVEAGQTLFQIEPEPYEDALASAKADLAEAQAQQLRAEREWQRVAGLFERKAVSERERDQARAEAKAAQARLEAARSALSNAERQLRYTRVEAPVSGLTSIEALTEGNLVEAGTVLTHIIQHDPVHVYFSLPEDDASAQRLARTAARKAGDESVRSAQLLLREGNAYAREGVVDFADRRVDPMTGTVQMRAVFPNPDGELLPGQFVRIRLALESYDHAVLIDPTAVGEGPQGPQVFTVNGENKAQSQTVELGPMVDGKQLILSGLEAGAKLVVNGQVALRDGAPVRITNAEQTNAEQEG
ncbi:efflux RND transporter periplasmic adaptor subunit [Marinimicrobium agarilyticum]|uniref:efflux RND transporter periplasmic adaptor subunit n=1 Tax=Marinimicrobium agarilyticum TaxID=306546 RepID=UPI00040D100A|nr:efflux RND transporter periplasmic adaptor subunit [Marinimicrobium agarilyticum]